MSSGVNFCFGSIAVSLRVVYQLQYSQVGSNVDQTRGSIVWCSTSSSLSLSLCYIPLQIIEAAVATVTAKDAILSQISTPKGNIV